MAVEANQKEIRHDEPKEENLGALENVTNIQLIETPLTLTQRDHKVLSSTRDDIKEELDVHGKSSGVNPVPTKPPTKAQSNLKASKPKTRRPRCYTTTESRWRKEFWKVFPVNDLSLRKDISSEFTKARRSAGWETMADNEQTIRYIAVAKKVLNHFAGKHSKDPIFSAQLKAAMVAFEQPEHKNSSICKRSVSSRSEQLVPRETWCPAEDRSMIWKNLPKGWNIDQKHVDFDLELR